MAKSLDIGAHVSWARAELGYAPRLDMRTGLNEWIDLLLTEKLSR